MRKLILLPLLLFFVLFAVNGQATAAPTQQEGNLLRNPGFEGNYSAWLIQYGTAQMAAEWTPWWIEDANHDPVWAQPEYKPAERQFYPDRVLEGDRAQQYFTFHKSHNAGMYQQVPGVIAGNTYRFTVWAQVWSSVGDSAISESPAYPALKIGIDPTGAAHPGSVPAPPSTIQWGEEASMTCLIDNWCPVEFETVAQNSTITVYINSSPNFAIKHNDFYFDNASLIQVAGSTTPPPAPNPNPGGGNNGGGGCVIPPSGPWPPCARGGGNTQAPPNSGGTIPAPNGAPGCLIPVNGPWPPCAKMNPNTGGGNSGGATCPIPPSGPWPPCARGGGGGGNTTPTNPTTPPPAPIVTGGFELGGQTHTLASPDQMKFAGMNWVKFQHKWSNGDTPEAVRGRIEDAHARGFKVLLSIPGSDHNNIDFAAYASFMGGVAALGPDALEVWNEGNIDREWPAGQISATNYVNQMLKPTYEAIKAANPSVMVISGAPAPTGFFGGCTGVGCDDEFYMREMAQAGGANYMDCIGIHYNEGIISPTQRSGDPRGNGGHYTRYFWGMVDTYYNAFNGSRPLCFTELGYLSGEGFGGLPAGFAWAGSTTVVQQAQWLAEATSLSASSGKIRMLIIFNVDFDHFGDDPQAGFAMIRPGGGCPACDSLRAVTGGR